MKRVNEILAVVILSLMAVLLAAVGMRLYDTYVINRQAETETKRQEEVLSRNKEAHDRVQEMRREIEELSGDREKLGQFLDEIRMDYEDAVPVSAMMDFDTSGMSGSRDVPEETHEVSENAVDESDNKLSLPENAAGEPDDMLSLSENAADKTEDMLSLSENEPDAAGGMHISGSSAVSENMLSLSGNALDVSGNDTGTVSENAPGISENAAVVSGNTVSISENDTVSENGLVSENAAISGNESVSGNMLDLLPKVEMVYPEVSLAERRQMRSSLEETLLANWEDEACLEERGVDFSGKKIACLGDSITAAANLEGEEGYLSYAYPSILKELLGAEEVYNFGIGGSSIGRYWSDAFVERYAQIPEDVDIIIVMGGTNDGFCLSEKEFGSLTERKPWTFCGDLDELMRGLQEKYPEADIFFATPLPNILQDYLMRERTYLLPQKNLSDMILTLSAAHEIPVIDLYNSNILDSHDADIVADYMPDGVHANKAGYRILAEHIAAELVRYYERLAVDE